MKVFIGLIAAIALLALALTCISDTSPYYQHDYVNEFVGQYYYAVVPNAVTPKGIRVDTSGLNVDLQYIDEQTDTVEACLTAKFGNPPVIPIALAAQDDAWCDSDTFPLPIRRHDLVVKIAGNWQPSCDGSEQVLPVPAPDALCLAKNMPPTIACPYCRWRAGIEDNKYIIVTPDLYLYKDPLIRLATGCNSPWSDALADCARL